jgi:hypothetical protein
VTHPKDVTIHNGDLWSIYKRTKEENQGRKEFKKQERKRESLRKILRQGRTKAELRIWKTSSQGRDALGYFGGSMKQSSK